MCTQWSSYTDHLISFKAELSGKRMKYCYKFAFLALSVASQLYQEDFQCHALGEYQVGINTFFSAKKKKILSLLVHHLVFPMNN